MSELVQITPELWEIPKGSRSDMRVPARVFADEELVTAIADDRSLEQLANVATLPGIVGAALAMPDVHQGYGFPVGGVAAMEVPDDVVSPGGVGSRSPSSRPRRRRTPRRSPGTYDPNPDEQALEGSRSSSASRKALRAAPPLGRRDRCPKFDQKSDGDQ